MCPINADARHLGRIGDALCALPYIAHLSEKHGGVYLHNGFNPWVFDGLDISALRIRVMGTPVEQCSAIDLDIHRVFHHCNAEPAGKHLHFAQGWFAAAGESVPHLPMSLPFVTGHAAKKVGRYAVLSPSSASDRGGNKFWPLDRWAGVCEQLFQDDLLDTVYVVGAHGDRGWDAFSGHLFQHVAGDSLPDVRGLMRDATITMTVDNGISHLCHFGGVARHFLLQPQCLTSAFVRNPLGRSIRGIPIDVTVDHVLATVRDMLT
jgi:hypothetical protein